MENIVKLLVDLFDVITDETNIQTKDSKGNYFKIEKIISSLSGIWKYLDYDKKVKISEFFVNLFMDYDLDKVKYEKLSKKTKTLPLLALVSPEEDITKLHIIYDRIEHKFLLSNKVARKNLMLYWHLKPTFGNMENTIDLLNSTKIKSCAFLRDFLLQNIKIQEIYLETIK